MWHSRRNLIAGLPRVRRSVVGRRRGRRVSAGRRSVAGLGVAQRAAGQGEEHVVERGPVHLDGRPGRCRRGRGRAAGPAPPGRRAAPGRGRAGPSTSTSPCRRRARPACAAASATWSGSRDLEVDEVAGDLRLEVVGGVGGDDPALVDDQDPVGERVGLVEVVGGQEHRRAAPVAQVARCAPTGWPGPAGRGRWSARRGTPASGSWIRPITMSRRRFWPPDMFLGIRVPEAVEVHLLEQLACRAPRRPALAGRRACRGPSPRRRRGRR